MKAILVLVALAGTAEASRPRNPDEPLPSVWTVGLRADVGDSADSYELSGRYEVGDATTGSVTAFGLEAVGGKLGNVSHLGVGSTAWIGPFYGLGLGARADALLAFDETMTGTRDLRPIARGSFGLRYGWIEAGYAFQLPIGGEREAWLATHSFYIGINTPLGFDR
jgi:hypothetical protein